MVTNIEKSPLKELLSHYKTKHMLTELLAKSTVQMFMEKGISFVVAYHRTVESNISGWSQFNHCHEEADTLLLCVIREIKLMIHPNDDVFVKLVSPDSDVFILHFGNTSDSCNTRP